MAQPRSKRGREPAPQSPAGQDAKPRFQRPLEGLGGAPIPALVLGLAGGVPFIVLAAAVALGPFVWSVRALVFLINYGAVILSFVGAVHWGLALTGTDAPSWRRLGWGVVPALLGWGAVNMYPLPALLVLALGFFVAFMADVRAANEGFLPLWYKALRRILTVLALVSLGVALVVLTYVR